MFLSNPSALLQHGGRTISSLSYSFPRAVTKISDLSATQVLDLIEESKVMKSQPHLFQNSFKHRTLLMLFEKPSLRTRVSFETGVTRMGGHAIFYSIADSPLGKKESIEDTAKILSRYVDVIMARVMKRETMWKLAEHSSIPVINALDDFAHPCQILTDLFTIVEKKGKLQNLKLAYFGDLRNNVTYDLLRAACLLGFHISAAGPNIDGFGVEQTVLDELNVLAQKRGGGTFEILHDAKKAAEGADVIYTDSWMSYGIPASEEEKRSNLFMPFQVNQEIMGYAKKNAIFMNCLPAIRGKEQTAEVIDGPQSVVFDQAENRMHMQNTLLLNLPLPSVQAKLPSKQSPALPKKELSQQKVLEGSPAASLPSSSQTQKKGDKRDEIVMDLSAKEEKEAMKEFAMSLKGGRKRRW